MHESVAIVYYNPFAIGVTVIVIGFRVAVFKYIVAHTVCYGAYLRGRAPWAIMNLGVAADSM